MFTSVVPSTQVFLLARSLSLWKRLYCLSRPHMLRSLLATLPLLPISFINLMSLVCFGPGRSMIIFLWPIFNLFTHISGPKAQTLFFIVVCQCSHLLNLFQSCSLPF